VKRRARWLAAGLALALLAPLAVASPANAALGPLLFGKKGDRSLGAGVFEVTARGNNLRERRSALDMALRKAAKRAVKEKRDYFAVLRQKSGSWLMNGRRIGDETTLRFRLLARPEPVLDDKGAPARIYRAGDILQAAD
jgi:hypothetical protein